MRFEPPKFQIDDESPWSASAFDLEETGNRLKNLVKNAEGPAVIALTAPWGTGKTTFLDMWSASLLNDGAKVVKFSAWEVDYTHDALVALIQELGDQLSTDKDSSEAVKKVTSTGAELLKHVAPFALKLMTSGLIDIDGIGDFTEKLVQQKLKAHAQAKQTADRFRSQLQEYAGNLESRDITYPLIIVVDELDRCRPSYAVETLEVIKHFFNVPGVVFVIGVDVEQLGEAIKGYYGPGYDGHRYLRKFFHLQVKLPEPDLQAFCQNTISKLGLTELFEGPGMRNSPENSFPIEFIVNLAGTYRLSLRDIERLVLEAGAIYAANPKFPNILSYPILWLLIQKQTNIQLFEEFAEHKLSSEQAWSVIAPFKEGLFKGEEHTEALFRATITLLLEGQSGIAELQRQARQLTEAENEPQERIDYWSRFLEIATDFQKPRYRGDFMKTVKSTMSLLGYR